MCLLAAAVSSAALRLGSQLGILERRFRAVHCTVGQPAVVPVILHASIAAPAIACLCIVLMLRPGSTQLFWAMQGLLLLL